MVQVATVALPAPAVKMPAGQAVQPAPPPLFVSRPEAL